MTVVLVDYGSGNLRSLRAAMERAGSEVAVAADPATVASARRLMVPGQGAAGPTMATLRRTGLEQAIREAVANGAYLLGVCVGLQLLFDASDEDATPCLGFLPGHVERLEGTARLPHMGWNDVVPAVQTPLFKGLETDSRFYFLHSYYFDCDSQDNALARTAYGHNFSCAVAAGNVYGVQFHPEKSHHYGAALLKNFAELPHAAA